MAVRRLMDEAKKPESQANGHGARESACVRVSVGKKREGGKRDSRKWPKRGAGKMRVQSAVCVIVVVDWASALWCVCMCVLLLRLTRCC